MADNSEIIDGPLPKRARRDDADLEIVLRFGDGEEQSYLRNATIFSNMSDFFDAALSTNMQERTTGVVALNDVTPEIFEQATKYLESPTAARRMTFEDAISVVEFYNKYQFKEGLNLCDDVCSEHVKHISKKIRPSHTDKKKKELIDIVGLAGLYNLKTTIETCDEAISKQIEKGGKKLFPDDLDFLIDMTVAAVQGDLQISKQAGIDYIVKRLGYVTRKKSFGVLMFTEERIKKLQPLFAEGLIPRELLPVEMQDDDAIFDNPRFSELFVYHTTKDARLNLVEVTIRDEMLIVDDPDPILFVQDDDGAYCANAVKLPGHRRCNLCLQKDEEDSDGDWIIFGDTCGDAKIWHCPGSSNLQYPPAYASAWKTVDRKFKNIEKMAIGKFSNPEWSISGNEESSDEED